MAGAALPRAEGADGERVASGAELGPSDVSSLGGCSGGSAGSSSLGGEVMPVVCPDGSNLSEVTVWVDALTDGLAILRYTTGFLAISGPTPAGTELAEWIVGGGGFTELGDLIEQLQSFVNQVLNEVPPGRQVLGLIRFRPPAAKLAGLEYHADCSVEFHPPTDEEEPLAVAVTLDRIQQRQRRHRASAHHSGRRQ